MSDFDYDLLVIGAGSGGVRASRLAAGLGARVAVAEEGRLGGTCVNVGCVPKKLLSYAAHFHEDFEDAAGFGWSVAADGFSWPTLIANKDREIARLNGVYQRILESAGVHIVRGRAAVADAHTVLVGEHRWRARHILVATGGWPVVPEIPGSELAITSNEAFHLAELPRRVIVVGGGYIAVEFASIFNGLGAETTLVYRGSRLLKHFDQDVGPFLADEMQKKGVRIVLDADIACIARDGAGLTAQLGDESTLDADAVMYATGRNPNTRGLGLEQAGVKLADNGAVIVDERFRSSVPSILAIGDAIHRIQLTPVALAEAICVANSLFGERQLTMNYENVPTAVFSHPNIATVGLTEAEARSRHGAVDVYRTSFRPLRHTLSGRDERSLMKLVVERAGGRVVGAHMVGADAGEIMQGIAVAVKLGATKAQFDATIGIHPTSAEEFVTLREKVPDA